MPAFSHYHALHAAFEGSIGCLHVLAPRFIYSNKLFHPAREQLLLGRFTGLLMWAVAFIGYVSRFDVVSVAGKAVMKGLAMYHFGAFGLNAFLGCGIDGNRRNKARDYFHAALHGYLAFGFMRLIYSGKTSGLHVAKPSGKLHDNSKQ